MLESLEKWWAKKYQLPSNHELFLDRTQYDLLAEFWEDYYESNPLEAHRNADGHVQFKDTGDTLIDKWEEQIARGEEPDLMEGFSEEQIEKLNKLQKQGRTHFGSPVRSLKETMDSVSSDAQRQGLNVSGLPLRKGWVPGPFGSGRDQ